MIRCHSGGIRDQPSMANPGIDDDGARRCCLWNLARPNRIHYSRLFLDSSIPLAWTAIRSLVHRSNQGSVRCHASPDFKRATPAFVDRMPSWCCRLRSWSLFVAVVARAVASWSCFRSLRLACIGSSDNQGNSISQKGSAYPITQGLCLASRLTTERNVARNLETHGGRGLPSSID